MFTSKEYRDIARAKLSGNWGRSVLVTFLAGLLGATGSGGGSAGSSGMEEYISDPEMATVLAIIISSAAVIALVMLIVGSAVELGHNRYYISLVAENKKEEVGILFSRFHIFGKALGLRLFIGLKVMLWSLLFIIPGIIAAYRYVLAPYIMAENPDVGIREAVEKSKELMKGHKWRYFCLEFSFIGWALLCVLTLGIGILWLAPYQYTAFTAFYYDRTGRSIPLAGQRME